MVVGGTIRGRGTCPVRQAASAVPNVLRQRLAACPPPSIAMGARGRAMLLLGFGAALRRSELVASQLGDVRPRRDTGCGSCFAAQGLPLRAGQDIAIWANPAAALLCPLPALNS